MTTKLVSANLGIILIVERDGKQEKKQFSVVVPSQEAPQPYDAMYYLKQFIEDALGMDFEQGRIPIAKPKKIKAKRPVSQADFNKKIKSLGY